jgi:hypothetical protein
MSPLNAEQVKRLLAKPERKPRKKETDTTVRDLQTWFKLAPKAMDANFQDLRCENPNCLDVRPPIITATGEEIKKHHVVEIGGRLLCRRCFLDGWLLPDPNQTSLED